MREAGVGEVVAKSYADNPVVEEVLHGVGHLEPLTVAGGTDEILGGGFGSRCNRALG